jgi:hypothetical protein
LSKINWLAHARLLPVSVHRQLAWYVLALRVLHCNFLHPHWLLVLGSHSPRFTV